LFDRRIAEPEILDTADQEDELEDDEDVKPDEAALAPFSALGIRGKRHEVTGAVLGAADEDEDEEEEDLDDEERERRRRALREKALRQREREEQVS
jgi:hypothetical protein